MTVHANVIFFLCTVIVLLRKKDLTLFLYCCSVKNILFVLLLIKNLCFYFIFNHVLYYCKDQNIFSDIREVDISWRDIKTCSSSTLNAFSK